MDSNCQAFLNLVRAGLWESDVRLAPIKEINFKNIYLLAQEQAVVGLVAAGLEHVVDVKPPKEIVLVFVGGALQIEQRNQAMDFFVGELFKDLNDNDISGVLVKGQGVAQCYEKPSWRMSGDIDILFDNENYFKARDYLFSLASSVDEEDKSRKHQAIMIGHWLVELHGTLHSRLLPSKMDDMSDEIQQYMFNYKRFRFWNLGEIEVTLPSADNDVLFVFHHILQHFFGGGIGLRQICDWCRVLWTYRDEINRELLKNRLLRAGMMTEWKAFAALAVNTLGMPVEAMPLYSSSRKWVRKSNRILALILESGNFGHNRDNSYRQKHSYVVYKAISLWRNTWDSMRHFMIFPMDATKVWWNRLWVGIKTVAQGK